LACSRSIFAIFFGVICLAHIYHPDFLRLAWFRSGTPRAASMRPILDPVS
jgi:hypothetical protein